MNTLGMTAEERQELHTRVDKMLDQPGAGGLLLMVSVFGSGAKHTDGVILQGYISPEDVLTASSRCYSSALDTLVNMGEKAPHVPASETMGKMQ